MILVHEILVMTFLVEEIGSEFGEVIGDHGDRGLGESFNEVRGEPVFVHGEEGIIVESGNRGQRQELGGILHEGFLLHP